MKKMPFNKLKIKGSKGNIMFRRVNILNKKHNLGIPLPLNLCFIK